MARNKVIFNGEVLIDLTSDTVDASHLLDGYTAHDKSGAVIEGTCTYDSDTSGDTASVSELLLNKTAHARGTLLTGTMPNNGAVSGTITSANGQYTIPLGYHDGSGKVGLSSTDIAKLIPGNIKSGVSILGITGEYTGEGVSAQTKTVTPDATGFEVNPESGYDYLASVVVNAIPYSESLNSAGGMTVTIG